MIYLDSAATANKTPYDETIIDAMTGAMRDYWQNPNSLYASKVRAKIDECRRNIADSIGADPNEIYFTSGASESNNWAIRGFVDYHTGARPCVVTTRMEHKSIDSLVYSDALSMDADIYYCENDIYGLVEYDSLRDFMWMCKDNPTLVSICLANNEIGTIQDVMSISKLVHKHKGVLHMDATQAYCKMPIDVKLMGIDMMSISGHKLSPALRGIGFLYKKNGVGIEPLIYGAQERGLRGSTENVAGIVGLNEALKYCVYDKNKVKELSEKRDYFIKRLEVEFGCKLNGHKKTRLCNNINVVLPEGISGESVLHVLSMSDIFISTSSACNSHSIVPSHVLEAIGLSDEEIMRSIRISISEDITYKDIECFINELGKTIEIIRE